MIEMSEKDMESGIVKITKKLDQEGLYDFLRKRVGKVTGRLTRTQLDIVSSLELALTTYEQVFDTVEKHLDTLTYGEESEKFRKQRVFANRYALFVGSEIGLRYLHNGEKQKERPDVASDKINLAMDSNQLISRSARNLILFLGKASTSDNSENRITKLADHYLHCLKNTSLIGARQYQSIFNKFKELEKASILGTDFHRFSTKDFEKREKKLTFKDYAGQEDVVDELKKVAEFVKSPHAFRKWGAKANKGIILTGGPGTGKTYLARVFADECGLPFYEIKLSDVLNEYYGKSASLVQELFTRPGVIFIDEMESLGRKVGDKNTHEATEQIVNTMKQIMDGADQKLKSYDDPITFYMGATNSIEVMEPALIRPGRMMPMHMQPYGLAGLAAVYDVQQNLIIKESTGEVTIFDKSINTDELGQAFADRGLVPADIEYILADLAREKAYEQIKKGDDVVLDPINQKDILEALKDYKRSDETVLDSYVEKTFA